MVGRNCVRNLVCGLLVGLAGCATPYLEAGFGRINRPIDVVWVGSDKFIYVPGPEGRNFGFETARTGRIIEPGLMYTDGGSIPRFAQVFKPFSPWGYAPAFIVHDWIFYGRYCELDAGSTMAAYEDGRRFADVKGITFHESAVILAEVIKTIEDNQQVALHKYPGRLISGAVDSVFAAALWETSGQCWRLRVSPMHIAMVWYRYNGGKGNPPKTWKLSPYEIREARRHLAWASRAVGSLTRRDRGTRQGVVGASEE